MIDDLGASPLATGLSPTVEPASGLAGSAASIPSAGRYRKKPVVIEAHQFFDDATGYGLLRWANAIQHARGAGFVRWVNGHMLIPTLEGVMTANPGDWIIQGVAGELYPCKPEIFDATYDVATEWTCAARAQTQPEPSDCDWPLCGCDPDANKVIAALEESGILPASGIAARSDETPQAAQPEARARAEGDAQSPAQPQSRTAP